jgi:alkylation response protein AidB-like acyl-CoA dehydrogenase
VDFSLTEDDEAIASSFDHFFSREFPTPVKPGGSKAFDGELWKKLRAVDVPGMAIREPDGGASLLQLTLVMSAAGARLVPVPLADAFACVRGLSDSSLDCYEDLCAGDLIGGVAPVPLDRSLSQEVPIGAVADVVVGVYRGRLVQARRAQHEQVPRPSAYGSLPLATWNFNSSYLLPLECSQPVSSVVDCWKLFVAAGLVGLAERALALGAAYAKERKAFGTPIARFQGVAHPLADVATACHGAQLLVQKAASTRQTTTGAPDSRLVSMAYAFAVETARQTSRTATHIHGGYGAATDVEVQHYHAAALAWPICGPSPSEEYLAIGRDTLAAGSLL